MTRNMLTLRAAPLMSAIFMRNEVTRDEKEQILSSVESEPGCKTAIRILAGKLLHNGDQPDMVRLYDLLKEG